MYYYLQRSFSCWHLTCAVTLYVTQTNSHPVQMQQQWTPPPQFVPHMTWPEYHVLPPNLSALTSHRLYYHHGKGQAGRASDQGHVWRRQLDGPLSDHRYTELHHPAKRRPQGQKVTKKLHKTKLKCPQTAQELQLNLDSTLRDLQFFDNSVQEQWASFKAIVHSATLEVLGPVTRHHQDWFGENDNEIKTLLEEKHCLLWSYQNNPSSALKKAAFTYVRSKVES